MIEYWILFIFVILVNLVLSSKGADNNVGLVFSFLLIFGFMAVRVGGFDYDTYESEFNDIKRFFGSGNYQSRFELGYVYLNWIMPNFRSLLVFLSAFTCITYYFLFNNYIPRKYYWLGFLLLALSGNNMLFFQMSGLRNAVAINILTLSIPFIEKRQIKKFAALTTLGFMFHSSIIFFMPLAYFVGTSRKITKRENMVWLLVILFFIVASATFVISYASTLINLYFDQYALYTDIAEEQVYERSILMYGFVLLMFAMTFLIMKKINLSKSENIMVRFFFLFLISLMLGSLNFRMSQYFAPFLIITTIAFVNKIKQPMLKLIYLSCILLFLWYSFIVVFMGNPMFLEYEYKTIFN